MDVDLDYETSDESVSSSDSEKEWSAIPKPQTWDEQRLQKLEKQQKIVQVASMKSAEHLLDDPVDKRGGIGRRSPWPQPHLSRLVGNDLMTI
jgi:hypothetical protein